MDLTKEERMQAAEKMLTQHTEGETRTIPTANGTLKIGLYQAGNGVVLGVYAAWDLSARLCEGELFVFKEPEGRKWFQELEQSASKGSFTPDANKPLVAE
jgi:hypothetical protein